MKITDLFKRGRKENKSKYTEDIGERPAGAEVMQPSKEELDSEEGEEQNMEYIKTFEDKVNDRLLQIEVTQKLIFQRQIKSWEKLEDLEKNQTVIIRMLMDKL